jgi:hypothetical protein
MNYKPVQTVLIRFATLNSDLPCFLKWDGSGREERVDGKKKDACG